MTIDRACIPFVLGALAPAAVLLGLGYPYGALACTVLAGFFAYFFRDPLRHVPDDSSLVLAPADGRVMHAGDADPAVAPVGNRHWQQVSIFLSPMDVHVNRSPVSGRVATVEYRPGRFLAAYRPEAASENERSEVWITHKGYDVVCRQVVGFLARRVVCRITPGMDIQQGDRLGIMKFGSRMDVFLPAESPVRLEVSVGDIVRGGESVLARFATSKDAATRTTPSSLALDASPVREENPS